VVIKDWFVTTGFIVYSYYIHKTGMKAPSRKKIGFCAFLGQFEKISSNYQFDTRPISNNVTFSSGKTK